MNYDDLFLWVVLVELDIADLDDFLATRRQYEAFVRQYLYSLLREKGLLLSILAGYLKKIILQF